MKRVALLLAAVALLGAGCTMLTAFNPEDQPCDVAAAPAQQCLSGFHCELGKCKRGAFDAGR